MSAEDQRRADERIPDLLATPAAVRFVSAEPLLGPIDFANIRAPVDPTDPDSEWLFDAFAANDIYYQRTVNDFGEAHYEPGDGPLHPRLDWVVTGGENGPRPTLRAWTRAIRDQCAAAGVAYFHKQNGEWIDADEHFDELSKYAVFRGADGKPFKPARPLNYSDAAIMAQIVGKPFEHHSDGSTLIRVGRKAAGRRLDSRTHDDMPDRRP